MESQFLGVPVSVTADEEKGRWEGVGRTEGLTSDKAHDT
jgi:hypothetical protein